MGSTIAHIESHFKRELLAQVIRTKSSSEQAGKALEGAGMQREKVPIKIEKAITVRYAIGGGDIPDYYSRREIAVPAKEKIPIEGLYEAALTQTGTASLQVCCWQGGRNL